MEIAELRDGQAQEPEGAGGADVVADDSKVDDSAADANPQRRPSQASDRESSTLMLDTVNLEDDFPPKPSVESRGGMA